MNSHKKTIKKQILTKMELLGSASIPKALLSMGIPTMIGMLINAFYNLADAYLSELSSLLSLWCFCTLS